MPPEERIKLLEKRCEMLARENTRFRQVQKDIHNIQKVVPSDRWYVAYLQTEISRLERQYSDMQDTLHTYQKHYSKWGEFYTRYENERCSDDSVCDSPSDTGGDNSGDIEKEGVI